MTANFQERTRTGVKRTTKWDKCGSEKSNQAKNNNFHFTNVYWLFVLSFQNKGDSTSYSEYYAQKLEIKDFHTLIDGKPFFDIPIWNKQEA